MEQAREALGNYSRIALGEQVAAVRRLLAGRPRRLRPRPAHAMAFGAADKLSDLKLTEDFKAPLCDEACSRSKPSARSVE